MASDTDPAPYFEDMFDILSKASAERLQSLRYHLESNLTTRKIDRLLCSAVLFILNRKGEAVRLVSDEKHKCRSAVHILNKIRGTEHRADSESKRDSLTPEDLEVRVDLAQIFAVLVEKQLCESSVRDRAYRTAVHGYRSCGQIDSVEFQDLLDESRKRCGYLDFNSEGDGADKWPLKSLDECSLRTRLGGEYGTRDETRGESRTSMNTSGDEQLTVPSHFEISATTTVPFISSSSEVDLQMTSKMKGLEQCGTVPSHSVSFYINNTAPDVPQAEQLANSGNTSSSINNSLEIGRLGTKPIECTEEKCNTQMVTSKTKSSPDHGTQDHLSPSLPDPRPTLTTSPLENPQASRTETHTSEETEENFENKFYSFVILHTEEDLEIAEKIRNTLEELGVTEGATFCEDFSTPGKSPISCIKDAVDNSAFTILLLTNNFNTNWTDYETNIVLMNSINNEHKYNTVIPMLTIENRLPKNKIPFALQVINKLDETSKYFKRHVRNTFTSDKVRKHKDKWLTEQKLQQIETQKAKVAKDRKNLRDITRATKQLGLNSEHYQREKQHLEAVKQYYSQPTFPIPSPYPGQMAPPMGHEPMLYPTGIQIPGQFPFDPKYNMFNPQIPFNSHMQIPYNYLNPNNGQGAQSVTINNSGIHPNQGPIIQIQHATNVQIGDSNQMTITESGKSDGSTDEDEEEETVGSDN